MPKFGSKSRNELGGVHEDLQELFNEAIKYVDLTIIEGQRSLERQTQLKAEGKTKTLKGKHLEGLAVDVAPYDLKVKGIDWEKRENFIYMGGFIMGLAKRMGIPLRWGGDWNGLVKGQIELYDNNFDDLVHFELDF